jgi:putative oxidoreductase
MKTTTITNRDKIYHVALLAFRVAVSLQLFLVHGLKKIGIGVPAPEKVPNPYNIPEILNTGIAVAANTICPALIILGFCTRLAALPVVLITLTGYFVIHGDEPLAQRDVPFMYSISFLLIAILGPGRFSLGYLLFEKNRQ